MARALRLDLSGALSHVTTRGDGREGIVLSDEDRLDWLITLAQGGERFHWTCHAYWQMTNHYYIVIETAHANLYEGMR